MMSDLVPCIASFTLGIGVTLIWVGLKFKEPVEAKVGYKNECIGYDERGKDK